MIQRPCPFSPFFFHKARLLAVYAALTQINTSYSLAAASNGRQLSGTELLEP